MKLFKSRKEKKKEAAKKAQPQYTVELGELMRVAATQPALRSVFYERLWDENLLLLLEDQSIPEGKIDRKEHQSVNVVRLPDGRVPVFTSPQRIFEGGHVVTDIKYISIKGRSLFTSNAGNEYVLNPFSQFGKTITQEEIEKVEKGDHLYDESRTNEITTADRVELIIPERYPKKMIDDLISLYRTYPEVDRAYMALIKHENSNRTPNYVVAIMTDGKFDEISAESGIVAKNHLVQDQIIEMMNMTKDSHFWKFFRHRKPFYRKDVNGSTITLS